MLQQQQQQQEQEQPSFINSLMYHKLDPYTKFRNGLMFKVGAGYGLILGCICLCILDVMFATSGYKPGPPRTPLLDVNIHSFNLSSSSSSSTVVDFSVRNPLPFALHVYLARASISRNHRLLATGFMQGFRVPARTPDRRLVMVTADLSLSSSSISDAAGLGVGFEFEVDGLVKVHEGSRRQRMRSIKVVCKDFEVLVSGPKKCVQSWGAIF